MRAHAILRFHEKVDSLLVSGILVGGDELAGKAAVRRFRSRGALRDQAAAEMGIAGELCAGAECDRKLGASGLLANP